MVYIKLLAHIGHIRILRFVSIVVSNKDLLQVYDKGKNESKVLQLKWMRNLCPKANTSESNPFLWI